MRVQGPNYRLDIAPAPQTTEDEAKQPKDIECDDNDDLMQRNKTTKTESETWKSEVEICGFVYHYYHCCCSYYTRPPATVNSTDWKQINRKCESRHEIFSPRSQRLANSRVIGQHWSAVPILRFSGTGSWSLYSQGRTGPPGCLAKARWAGAAVGRFDKNDNFKMVSLSLLVCPCVCLLVLYSFVFYCF